MEALQDNYRDDEDDGNQTNSPLSDPNPIPEPKVQEPDPMYVESAIDVKLEGPGSGDLGKVETLGSEDDIRNSSDLKKTEEPTFMEEDAKTTSYNPVVKKSPPKKKKSKNNCVWTKPTSRKWKKRAKNFHHGSTANNNNNNNGGNQNQNQNQQNRTPLNANGALLLTPFPRLPYKNEDTPDAKIVLSKLQKAEKVELSEDRLSAGSSKGYRMVRTTRGVIEGAWFFEIKVVRLGETGHTRLGWSTEKGDLQAPVGYDGCSFGYRDVDGSKVHKALREKYGDEGYRERDVIGFYVSLPEGSKYAPKGPPLVVYKGQKYVCTADYKEEEPKSVPGSEISFYKNGICQGVAFKDVHGGCYYPAASMYTLPDQPNCTVKFNFGPDFDCFPTDFQNRPIPKPMIDAPYHGPDDQVENGAAADENKH